MSEAEVAEYKMKKRSVKKTLLMIICIILALCVITAIYAFSVNAYVMSSSKDRILSSEDAAKLTDCECILVLGAGVQGTTLSHMLEDRVVTGINLYDGGAAPKILMSGDHGSENYDEVNAMKDYAKEKGVPSDDIFMDHAGFSTYESMYRAKYIFGVTKMIVVSQEYHLYRALYIAQKLGIEAYGVDGQIRTYDTGTNVFNTVREMLARNKDFIKTIFKPKSTYMGEAIPINGSGDATNDKA